MNQDLILTDYGVTLRRLTHDKIEMLRQWRNDPKIQRYMIYREYITPEMQKKWFTSVNNDNNFYFIISYEDRDIGLVNLKDINYETKSAESGIFIYDDSCLNCDIGVRAALSSTDFAFENLKLDSLYGHVLKTNRRAILFNSLFGYALSLGQEGFENQLYTLDKKTYFQKRDYLRNLLGY